MDDNLRKNSGDNEAFTDDTLMHFGTHKDKKLINVPASYLLWWQGMKMNKHLSGKDKLLFEYIVENADVLEKQAKMKGQR